MTTEISAKRLRAYSFSEELLIDLLRHGREYGNEEGYDRLKIVEGIPEGAVLHSAQYDMLSRMFVLVVEHPSFEKVQEAVALIPERVIRWNDLPWGAISASTFIKGHDGDNSD